ncbi:MAG: response regulator [Prevotellaceae bacterium]|jgi:signal transduction histidine kinase/CheY-like chemotaxis protein|nr:response regulator [Prevotellaceae bacterium]
MAVVLAVTVLLFFLVVLVFLREAKEKAGLQAQLQTTIKEKYRLSRTFDAVFHSIHAYVLLVDRDMQVYQTNYYERIGRASETSAGKKLGEVIGCVNCVEHGGFCGSTPACKNCAVRRLVTQSFLQRKGFPDQEIDLVLVPHDGKYQLIHALIAGSYVDVDGMDNMVITVHDITELTHSRFQAEKMQRVVSFISSVSKVGFAALDLMTDDEIITPEYCVNLGESASAKAIQIFHSFRYLYPDDREQVIDFMQRAEKGRVEPLLSDVRVQTGDAAAGTFKWVRLFMIQREFPTNNASNEIYSLTIDVSSTKQLEQELIVEREKAMAADKAKSLFLANMSHEIRTPLNAITGFSELLSSAKSPEEIALYQQVLKTNVNMLMQLVNDILDMSKIEAGTLDFNYTDVDVRTLMDDMSAVFRLRMSEEGSAAQLIYEPMEEPCTLHIDRTRVGQVISNFLSNAVKFTDQGSITIGYKPCADGIYFYVSDTGSGIPKDKQENVFQRFARIQTGKQGNGLGLSISKTIIEKMGGRIGFESEQGKGSTFWFVLPKSTIVGVPIAMSTILVAEDMEDNYHLCEVILEKKFRLLWAHDGAEAVKLFYEQHPDLILMDLKMPVMDGYAATNAIRKESATVPIIALTAFAFAEDKQRVLGSGFTDYLTKPIRTKELLNVINKYL